MSVPPTKPLSPDGGPSRETMRFSPASIIPPPPPLPPDFGASSIEKSRRSKVSNIPTPPPLPSDFGAWSTEKTRSSKASINATPPHDQFKASLTPPLKPLRAPPQEEVYSSESEYRKNPDAISTDDSERLDFVPCRDFFFDSNKVLSLNSLNFTTFLNAMDATLVMFYDDIVPECTMFQKVVSEAADNTKRANHAFAGVDCGANKKLCVVNNVIKVPLVRVYSKTFCLGEMATLHKISPDTLRQYVEMSPVFDQTRMVSCGRTSNC